MEDAVFEGIPGTSLWGLKARAEEDARADGLFKDPLAVKWFQRLEPFFGGPIAEWYNPVLQQAIALRTDILDDAVRTHLARCQAPAVVELGAGFSTRFSRLMPDCPWFELDLPEMIELRLSMGETPAPRHSLLADSIFSPDWLTALDQQDPEQVFLIAEGLLMYFPLSRVEQLFKLLNRSLPGAWIAFDVMGGWNVAAAKGPGDEVAAPIYWGLKYLDQAYQQFGVSPAGDLTLPTRLKSEPGYQRRIKPLTRWLLGQRWLTRRMGGTVLARLKRPD
ncbi:MAG: class I SAM-dependent methyltransferase [Candidatus Sericytochromatia bacterium]